MNMNEMSVWEKPREKMMRDGAGSLSTAEVIAVILGTGRKNRTAVEVGAELLALSPRGLRHLAECSPEELKQVKGLGDAKACQLIAAIELGKRLASMPAEQRQAIQCSDDIAGLFMEKLRHEKKEHFRCILINSRGEILEDNEVSTGDLTSSTSHPREVFARAVKRSAGSVALVHNHPSGNPEPSDSDIETNRRLVEVGKLLGIPVIDHIIIGDGTYASMKAMGLM